MKKVKLLFCVLILSGSFLKSFAQKSNPDTVTAGIYITSIHDIDFKQKEYSINFWLWLKYKNKDFDFLHNLEIPQAKSFTQSYSTGDSSGNRIYVLMKLQCVMKDSWRINRFPFDRQVLRLTIENSQFDSTSLIFAVDTLGEYYGRFTINGWLINKDSFNISVRNQPYQTAFGDESYDKPYSAYSAFRLKIKITREAEWTSFWKIFLGMYVAFMIAFACFYIHTDSIESRFNLSVGSLFAAIGNKYVVDSALPDSSSPTLVDTLHGLTLVFIFVVIASTIYALKLVRENKVSDANRFDKIMRRVTLLVYAVLNIYFISKANSG
jgi:hypothetical protein